MKFKERLNKVQQQIKADEQKKELEKRQQRSEKEKNEQQQKKLALQEKRLNIERLKQRKFYKELLSRIEEDLFDAIEAYYNKFARSTLKKKRKFVIFQQKDQWEIKQFDRSKIEIENTNDGLTLEISYPSVPGFPKFKIRFQLSLEKILNCGVVGETLEGGEYDHEWSTVAHFYEYRNIDQLLDGILNAITSENGFMINHNW